MQIYLIDQKNNKNENENLIVFKIAQIDRIKSLKHT
jgi:hypothetical protein